MESCVPGRYQTLRTIPEFECDFNLRLTAGGLLRLVQEVSTRHCTLLGITMERYQQTHTAFLLAKLCARVYEDIPAGAEVTITSLPSSPIRAVYHRYTTLSLPDGRTAAAVDARWMLVDTQSRRILRRAPEELGLPFDMAAVPELPIRITRPREELLPAGEEVACYSRCDQNRHMNNTRYADIICPWSGWRQGRCGSSASATTGRCPWAAPSGSSPGRPPRGSTTSWAKRGSRTASRRA